MSDPKPPKPNPKKKRTKRRSTRLADLFTDLDQEIIHPDAIPGTSPAKSPDASSPAPVPIPESPPLPAEIPSEKPIIEAKAPPERPEPEPKPSIPVRDTDSQSLGFQVVTSGEPTGDGLTKTGAEEQILSADTVLTPTGWESLRLNRPVAHTQKLDQSTTLAYALPFQGASSEVDQTASLLLEFIDDSPDREWSEDELTLVEQVTDQLSLALENAHLFEQTQSALSALEISARYQESIAQAVTALTERGLAALSDVLELLGAATQASRVFYMETQADQRGAYWRLIDEWCAQEIPSQIGNPTMRRLSTSLFTPWIEQLRADGYVTSLITTLSSQEKQIMGASGSQSFLQFAVPGRHDTPGCIGFEQMDYPREWGNDEIAALQTAASALANTIAREDLFTQVQINLAETEALYQASARLNSAADYEDILSVLRQHTILGHNNASNITINVFNRTWQYRTSDQRSDRPEWLTPLARWPATPYESKPTDRYDLRDWPAIDALLQPEQPTMVMDPANDPRIDRTGREIYVERMEAKSLIYAPLNVAGQWIGHIIGVYQQTTGFPDHEVRRLMSLAGQAAIAVQNLQSIDLATDRAREAQTRSEELSLINQFISAAGQTLDLDEVLTDLMDQVLTAIEFKSGLISITDVITNKLFLAVHQGLPPQMVEGLLERGLDGTPCDFVYQTGEMLYIDDLNNFPEEIASLESIFEGPKNLGFQAYLGVPIVAKGQQVGTICAFNFAPHQVPEARQTLMQSMGQQIGVLIDNARLFQQTENALSETEILYIASSELNAAKSYVDILDTLRNHSILGQVDHYISIDLFEHPWVSGDIPEHAKAMAHWIEPNPTMVIHQSNEAYSLSDLASPANILRPDRVTIIENVQNDPRLNERLRTYYLRDFNAHSVILVPLVVGGLWIGFVNAIYGSHISLREEDSRRLQVLAGQAAIASQNLRLLEESSRRANQLQTAAEIARDTSGTLALDTLLQRTVGLLLDRFGYYHASVFLIDEDGANAVVSESTGPAGEEMKRSRHKLAVGGRSVIGQVTQSGEPVVLNDVNQAEAVAIHYPNPLLPHTQAELGLPLKIGDRVIGALDVQSTEANAFPEDDILVLTTLTDQIAVAVDNARAYELAQQAVEEIREADRLKSQFLANMSHELRTPLNSIIGFSRVILKGIDGPINDLQQQDLSAIYNSGQHLLGLINDVLDLSKIEAGKMELTFEDNVNFANIIKGVMSTTVGLVKDKPVELKQNIAPDLPLLQIDPLKVRQVLLNLLSNAAKFTEEGSITVNAIVQTQPDDRQEVLVKVIDTGQGVAPGDQAKLFQPFSQVDGSLTRKTGGSGLGLSICHHLIAMHGGRIGLTSEIGKGSTFFFTLPVGGVEIQDTARVSQPELPDIGNGISHPIITPQTVKPITPKGPDETSLEAAPVSTPEQSLIDEDLPSETLQTLRNLLLDEPPTPEPADQTRSNLILAIDQDHQVINLYRYYLADLGSTVIAVTELDQAVTVAKGIQPSAITLDIAMQSDMETQSGPMDGWWVLKELKSDPNTKHIPIIICSLLDEREKALNLGASDYLAKPILEADLSQAIQRLGSDRPAA